MATGETKRLSYITPLKLEVSNTYWWWVRAHDKIHEHIKRQTPAICGIPLLWFLEVCAWRPLLWRGRLSIRDTFKSYKKKQRATQRISSDLRARLRCVISQMSENVVQINDRVTENGNIGLGSHQGITAHLIKILSWHKAVNLASTAIGYGHEKWQPVSDSHFSLTRSEEIDRNSGFVQENLPAVFFY